MRAYELLRENIEPIVSGDESYSREVVIRVADFILENCSQWWRETDDGGIVFYRGLQANIHHAAFVKPVRTDREPRDSLEIGHDAYNAMIEAVGGIANRSNSLFVISDLNQAMSYGSSYFVVLPIGDYSYTWSKGWDDWNISEIDTLDLYASRYLKSPSDIPRDDPAKLAEKEYEEEVLRLDNVLKNKYVQDQQALEDELEYLISDEGREEWIQAATEEIEEGTATKYYEVFTDPDSYSERLLKNAIMVDKELAVAADQRHEVMIACKEAFYVDYTLYEDVWRYLNGKDPFTADMFKD